MEHLPLLAYQTLYAIALLVLTSIGLAIAFGMMKVINFAHGEFIMLGGYTMTLSVHAGVNFWVAMFVVTPLMVGVFGIVVERLILRQLYGRILDTILATWGLSLLLMGTASAIFGFHQKAVPVPFGTFSIQGYSQSLYSLFLILVTLAVMGGLYVLLRHTRYGLLMRGTMQNPTMAAALGVSRNLMYASTFGLGAAMAGLAGAVIAPLAGVAPTMGLAYVSKAFITVITGGANAYTGTAIAAIFYGAIQQIATFLSTPVIAEAAILVAGIILLRLMPNGITGRFFRRSL